ncbi:MAG: GMC family oxidoreductase N-terminal domain-containing protein [Planctomycetota bacterium]
MTKLNRRDAMKAALAASATQRSAQADFAPLASLPVIVQRTVTGSSELKRRAIADHAINMRPFGGALARHGRFLSRAQGTSNGPADFDVLIIGSGYGASICAARLASAKRPGVRIGLIERGKEWIPGTFGDTLRQSSRESRFNLLGPRKGTIKNPVGLVNVMQNDEVNVVSGSGLGGSSLINASVAIRPDRDCFSQSEWPLALQDSAVLDPYYDRASVELGVAVEPPDASPKARAQRLAGQNLAACGARVESAAITVTRAAGSLPVVNRQGMLQRGCVDCGDCNSGCNVGAKNTLAMNYLPLARRLGVEMYTHTEVTRVEKINDLYRVHFKTYVAERLGRYNTTRGSVTSRMVVLGAGSIGSNEILLRSRGCGMKLSEQLGQRWTMNGDALGFVRKSRYLTNIAAHSAYPHSGTLVGPTIQTNLTYPGRQDLAERVLIQDGSVSRGYTNILGALMLDMDFDQTMAMLGMGHDGSSGRVELGGNGLASVKWPGLKDSAYRKLIRNEFAQVARAHGGEYKFLKLFGDNFITVHPLGGCAMADDPVHGVVDDMGRVFDPAGNQLGATGSSTGLPVHRGLYVADGAVIPRSIGCNPLLTISALAERIAEGIANDPMHQDLFVSSR